MMRRPPQGLDALELKSEPEVIVFSTKFLDFDAMLENVGRRIREIDLYAVDMDREEGQEIRTQVTAKKVDKMGRGGVDTGRLFGFLAFLVALLIGYSMR